MDRKVGFAAVFTDIITGAPTEEASIHTDEMTPMKVAFKEMHKRVDKNM